MSFDLIKKDDVLSEKSNKITIIPEYIELKRLIENKQPLIFLTGGAGTGKSVAIRWLMNEFSGKILLGAPTGIAALNIGAKTLHSMCLLPPAWILDSDIKEMYRKKEILRAKILIIDEISMVNPNMLDAVDKFFKLNRGSKKPFGGLITIMVGDLYQLPPVVTEETEELFAQCYDSPYFYSADCIKGQNLKTIQLKKTFRQKDNAFIDILLNIRRKKDIKNSVNAINTACKITLKPKKGAVRLSPRNVEVERHNLTELRKLSTPEKVFTGVIKGVIKLKTFPSPMNLALKEGAQVMFTQNDPVDGERRWINGTVGIVKQIKDISIMVEIINSDVFGGIVEVTPARWSTFNYTYNDRTSTIERIETGYYEQYPLQLAWAATIHKSQGKTIDLIHIDLGKGAFAPGQTYVALSRCPKLTGISLSRAIEEDEVIIDEDISSFYANLE